jgi:hypothetical protein
MESITISPWTSTGLLCRLLYWLFLQLHSGSWLIRYSLTIGMLLRQYTVGVSLDTSAMTWRIISYIIASTLYIPGLSMSNMFLPFIAYQHIIDSSRSIILSTILPITKTDTGWQADFGIEYSEQSFNFQLWKSSKPHEHALSSCTIYY